MPVSDVVVDPAFSVIRKDFTGFHVWRIENFQVIPVPAEHFGKFYNGDSYIIYSSSEFGKINKSTEKGKLVNGHTEIHIHFWIGSESSQDEAAVAAVKTVELDLLLGGTPIQHREAQGKESKRFYAYFPQGVRYLVGGVETGFHHVKRNEQAFLYSVKGRRTVIVQQLPEVSWKFMNHGDVFVLDCHSIIFVWTGTQSNYQERLQGAKFAVTLRGEKSDAQVTILEDGQEQSLPQDEQTIFDHHLPITQKEVSQLKEAEPDEEYTRRLCSEMKLYQCSDEDGTLKVVEVKHGPFQQSDLNSNDSYILDNGPNGIWVWIGKRATRQEREEALRNAQGFITKKGYIHSTPVTRIVDGGEPADFKTLFQDWRNKHQTKGYVPRRAIKKISATVQTKFDVSTLHQLPQIAAETQMVDGGDGQMEVWRVRNFDLVEVDPSAYGEFYSGDCYVVLYAYEAETQKFIIYYWIGAHSSIDKAGTAALKTIELDNKLEGRAVQARVCQGKEPPHFMTLFKGKMTVFSGGFASKFDGNTAKDSNHESSYMLQVRGTSPYNTRATEVPLSASSLNSGDCFIVVVPESVFVWCGKGSTGDEREVAKTLAAAKKDPVLISEGGERSDFWEMIGGKTDYLKITSGHNNSLNHEPRLFYCTNSSGIFRAEEILDFNQQDLIEDDVMILDTWHSIFVWIGKHANIIEREGAEELAFEYLRTDPAQRGEDTPVYRIKQGYEPPTFTGHFVAWVPFQTEENGLMGKYEKIAPGANILVTIPNPITNGTATVSHASSYPLSALADLENLPEGVDRTKREEYLSDTEFQKLFHLDKEEFYQIPRWKRINLKKSVGLF